jgi:nitroimidazol reductase NimA-like FMN-containing flavoprotein (pyridoxamine 5'-phosphate oxidase superfamily)
VTHPPRLVIGGVYSGYLKGMVARHVTPPSVDVPQGMTAGLQLDNPRVPRLSRACGPGPDSTGHDDAMDDYAAAGRAIIDANLYMVLGTADESGAPWVSPVYFAPDGYRNFLWVSKPTARHSFNIAVRADVSIVVFDSSVPIGQGQGVYMPALAEELAGDEAERCIEVFSRRSLAHGGVAWSVDDVQPPARHRLYRASATEHFVLDARDERV